MYSCSPKIVFNFACGKFHSILQAIHTWSREWNFPQAKFQAWIAWNPYLVLARIWLGLCIWLYSGLSKSIAQSFETWQCQLYKFTSTVPDLRGLLWNCENSLIKKKGLIGDTKKIGFPQEQRSTHIDSQFNNKAWNKQAITNSLLFRIN